MRVDGSLKPLILAVGMQSSGSTLISWCFLQHSQIDGVMDGDGDIFPQIPPTITAEYIWFKTTISSFTLADLVAVAEDEGYLVKPVVIVRDPRAVWLSLAGKSYGRNGITVEDPSLRLRFRHFLSSWHYALKNEIPICKFEDFVENPEETLKDLCQKLEISWDNGMLEWPKHADQIANTRHGNATFRESAKTGLIEALKNKPAKTLAGEMFKEDLDWLDKTFRHFNETNGYPKNISEIITRPGRAAPSWDNCRRKKWRLKQKFFRYLMTKLKLVKYSPRPE